MNLANRISFVFLAVILFITGWLNLGMVLLSVLFAYLALGKLHKLMPRSKGPAIVVFIAVLGFAAYGLAFFIKQTATALPDIAQKAVPAITQWATEHHINLPFTDFDSLKDETLKAAGNQAKNLGLFADFAGGATRQFIYFLVGCVVAMGIFLNPKIEIDHPSRANKNNLYTLSCEAIEMRFARFYESFEMVMKAQVIIAAIDATLTGIFIMVMGLPHVVVAVGITFLCGLLPVVGNLLSNTVVVGIGFTVSPLKGLGALAFLVFIHQLEYFLNSKIIGGKIRSSLWLTLVALVVGEALMGITGMILAPAILHYIRIEASAIPIPPKQT